ncbi:MAG: methionyl-tRNA formyltransferase [Desulfatiglans sp.]|jgi:methionyl-tRNA formyltransferase|nr:methionyl-tRNA formyltransferase [Desulfatiglans sp.]
MGQVISNKLPERPKIIYMGTPDFAVPALKSLVNAGYDIEAVITQPDKPKGRGLTLSPCPVNESAISYGLNVMQPSNVNDHGFIEGLRLIKPDLFIVAAFGQLLRQELLAIPKFGAINIHASLLPLYRGAAPIQWAILDNRSKTGITLMKMTKGLDKGPVLYMHELAIKEYETAGQLFDRLAAISGDVIVRFLRETAGKEITGTSQDDALSSYASKITKEMARIDWTRDAVKIAALIRAMDPFPGATTVMNGKNIKLFTPVVIDKTTRSTNPGKIITDDPNRFMVETGEGIIEIGEIQPPNKKRMTVKAFVQGNRIEKETMLL